MLLDRRELLVKERIAVLKLTDTYDLFDLASGQPIGLARDEPPDWAKYLRLLVNKNFLPTTVNVYESESAPPVLVLHKGASFLRSTVRVESAGRVLGSFRSKLFSLGGGFWVQDAQDQPFAEVKGDWKGWNFRFLSTSGSELGLVTKKWAGLGRELFTSADNYVVSLGAGTAQGSDSAALLLAAGLAIDLVFKERK